MAQQLQATGIEVSGLYIVGDGAIWEAEPRSSLDIDFDGIAGDRHAELTRVMQPYESEQMRKLVVANDKHVSLVSGEDMVEIATGMDLDISKVEERSELSIEHFVAKALAANILVSGEYLNNIALPGLILAFCSDPGEVKSAVRVTEYNAPCQKPLTNMLASLRSLDLSLGGDFVSQKERFKEVAAARRGWVGSVYIAGSIEIGDRIYTHTPVVRPEQS